MLVIFLSCSISFLLFSLFVLGSLNISSLARWLHPFYSLSSCSVYRTCIWKNIILTISLYILCVIICLPCSLCIFYVWILYSELCFLSSANVQCYWYCYHFGEYTRGCGTDDHARSDCCCGGDVYQEDAIKTRWVKWLQCMDMHSWNLKVCQISEYKHNHVTQFECQHIYLNIGVLKTYITFLSCCLAAPKSIFHFKWHYSCQWNTL